MVALWSDFLLFGVEFELFINFGFALATGLDLSAGIALIELL